MDRSSRDRRGTISVVAAAFEVATDHRTGPPFLQQKGGTVRPFVGHR